MNIVPETNSAAAAELKDYYLGSFGNSTRIDYGSGHELAFIAFLCCLFMLDLLHDEDLQAIATRIMPHYLAVVRKLQLTYVLEPAVSLA